MHPLLKRQAATQACMDRYAFKPMEPGKRDCGGLAAHAMHQMGRNARLLNASPHKTMSGAVKYIRKSGFKDLLGLMDATRLKRIAPAAALPGDIIALASEEGDGFGCSLSVALDNGRVLAFNPLSGLCEPMEPLMTVAAWRV